MSELRKCPFCGGEAYLVDYGLTGAIKVVQCSDCGARTRAFNPEIKRGENASDAWNRRVEDHDGDAVSRNAVIQKLNTMDRYVSEELRLCDTDKKFPKNEVFIVDDVYEEIVENLSPDKPKTIKCKDCVHRPIRKNGYIMPPEDDDERCPCICEDLFYSWMPGDDFFCANGERREE